MSAQKAVQKEVGIQFPKGNDGLRSTSETGKNVFAASIRPVDVKAADAILAEKKWRFRYGKYVVQHVEKAAVDPANALRMSQTGLEYVHKNFVFVRDGKEVPVAEAIKWKDTKFTTGVIHGKKQKPKKFDLEVPYGDKVLRGDDLLLQLEKWVRNGTIEMSCGHAISQVVKRREWLDLSDKYFVLLGALSAMGPLRVLLALGANIVAVDINVPRVWKALIELAENSCGTMYFPLSKPQDSLATREDLCAAAGCDLMGETPEVKNWLVDVCEDKPLMVGSYAYLDADRFVRLSVAMDAIVQELCVQRKGTQIAYLCTPTDCHVIPASAHEAQTSAFRREAAWMGMLRLLSGGSWLTKNARKPVDTTDGDKLHVVDAIVVNQGPNYILAKRIQHWRAVVAREVHKCVVSTNIAPSTATASVVSNRSFAWAYNGMHNFKPMEVFRQETSNAVMTAMLIYDTSSTESAANPAVVLKNPMCLFTEGAFHGGPWRTAHKFTSIGTPSALLYFLSLAVRIYLTAYNFFQTVGWCVCFGATVKYLADPSTGTVWQHAGNYVTIYQFVAILEILHSALGFVSADTFTTFIQVFSRLLLVGIVSTNPVTHTHWGVALMLFCWTLTEVVRYGYFAVKLAGLEISVLTWLRYSLFFVLYPAGVLGEVMTATAALPTMHYTLSQINTATAESSTVLYAWLHRAVETVIVSDVADWMRYFVFPAYFLGLPFLYMHMVAQRKKVLRGVASAAASSKKQKKD
eukprot:c9393_g1_i1.p1 GENE.c9393_g1_i1~~c9393_g1_i1.p1  ORF type:complete len:771 (-),score=263.09 c9393_g1_i1:258-2495(-)